MSKDNVPITPVSALDFCTIVDAKQRNLDGLTAVALAPADQQTLSGLLQESQQNGRSTKLEERARQFLFTYRESEKYYPVLSPLERKQLEQILEPRQEPSPPRPAPVRTSYPAVRWTPRFRWRYALAALGVAAVIAGGFTIRNAISSSQAGPPAGVAQQHPPAQNVAPSNTDLQNLKQNYGPWQQLTPSDQQPQTGQPALLLLEDGGYFASTMWTVPASASGWQQDITGDVDNVDVNGNYADITDADGAPYIVGIDQPFIVSSNPGTVLRIDSTGNVLSMTLAQATAVRQSLHQ